MKSCGTASQEVDPDAYSKPMRDRVDAVLKHICNLMDQTANSASDAQGMCTNTHTHTHTHTIKVKMFNISPFVGFKSYMLHTLN